MAQYVCPAVSVAASKRGTGPAASDRGRMVVWLRGEHDIASRARLSTTMAYIIGLDDSDIVIDLSGVTFMDASTVSAIVSARQALRLLTRSLDVRAPSPPALRLLNLCGLADLIDTPPPPVRRQLASALAT